MSKEVLSHAAFAHLVNTNQGASRTFRDKSKVTGPGVMVSEAGSEKTSTPPLTPTQAKNYFNTYLPSADEKIAHGGWKESNVIYQDKSKKYTNLNEARNAGTDNKQIAGYDLGGTDTRRPEGGNVYFGRDLPGVESDPEFKGSANETSVAERVSPRANQAEAAETRHISRGATRRNKNGAQVPVTYGEVLGKIAKNRRNRGV